MKTIVFMVVLFTLTSQASCISDDRGDFECVEIGLIHREFDYSELSPYRYDSNGYMVDLDTNIVRMIDFGLLFDIFFHDIVIHQVREVDYCSDVKLLDLIVDVNIYLKTPDDYIDITDSFRNFGTGTRKLSNLFFYTDYLERGQTFILDLVDYSQIPDTAIFVSELVFSTGEVDQNETDTLYFY